MVVLVGREDSRCRSRGEQSYLNAGASGFFFILSVCVFFFPLVFCGCSMLFFSVGFRVLFFGLALFLVFFFLSCWSKTNIHSRWWFKGSVFHRVLLWVSKKGTPTQGLRRGRLSKGQRKKRLKRWGTKKRSKFEAA